MLMDDWLLYVTCLVLVSFQPITCSEPNVSAEYCSWDTFETKCLTDEIVVMETARYGRMAMGRCVKQDMGVLGCYADVIQYMDHMCTGRSHCKVVVPNPDIDKLNLCSKEVTSYLEATYSCKRVINGDPNQCRSMKPYLVKEPRGFFSNHVTLVTGCGSNSSPWLLEAMPGQKFNLSLWNVDRHGARNALLKNNKAEHCQKIFTVVQIESTNHSNIIKNNRKHNHRQNEIIKSKEPIVICSDPQVRVQHVLLTSSHYISLSIIHQPPSTHTSAGPTHLIEFNVVGCADFTTNDRNSWTKRMNDVTAIGCHDDNDQARWKVRCVVDRWVGEVGKCEENTSDVLSSRGGDNLKITSVLSFIIVVCISFIIGICVLIIGLVWMHRKRKLMQNNSPPETSYFNKMECFKAHEGNKTVVLSSCSNNNADFELYNKSSATCKLHQHHQHIKMHPQNKYNRQQQQRPTLIRSCSPNYPVSSSAVLFHGYQVGSVDLINSAITSTCAVHHQPTCSTTTADDLSTFSSNANVEATFYSPFCPRHYLNPTTNDVENQNIENINTCVNQQSFINHPQRQAQMFQKDSSLYACIKDGGGPSLQTFLPEASNNDVDNTNNHLVAVETKINCSAIDQNNIEGWKKINSFGKLNETSPDRLFNAVKSSPKLKSGQNGDEVDKRRRRFSVSCYQDEQNYSDC